MIRVLRPWFANLGNRLVKSPKVYLRDSGILHFPLGLEEQSRPGRSPRIRGQLGRIRPGADADRPRPARRVLLRHAARGRTGPSAAAPRPPLGIRVQVHRDAPHHEINAHRDQGPRVGTPLGGLSRRARVPARGWDHGVAAAHWQCGISNSGVSRMREFDMTPSAL